MRCGMGPAQSTSFHPVPFLQSAGLQDSWFMLLDNIFVLRLQLQKVVNYI